MIILWVPFAEEIAAPEQEISISSDVEIENSTLPIRYTDVDDCIDRYTEVMEIQADVALLNLDTEIGGSICPGMTGEGLRRGHVLFYIFENEVSNFR